MRHAMKRCASTMVELMMIAAVFVVNIVAIVFGYRPQKRPKEADYCSFLEK
jgi:hypothetical protein